MQNTFTLAITHLVPFIPESLELLDECACAIILIKNVHNFLFNLNFSDRPIIHSGIYFRHYISTDIIRIWKEKGLMVSPYGVSIRHFGFLTLYDKNELLREQSNLKGILTPCPWWAWITTGALGVSASFLMSITKGQNTEIVWVDVLS